VGARISWRDVAGIEGQLELGFTEIFIGRAVECAVRTEDPLVSRRHARIYFMNGAYVIEDSVRQTGSTWATSAPRAISCRTATP